MAWNNFLLLVDVTLTKENLGTQILAKRATIGPKIKLFAISLSLVD